MLMINSPVYNEHVVVESSHWRENCSWFNSQLRAYFCFLSC